jgi:hypothetical protein
MSRGLVFAALSKPRIYRRLRGTATSRGLVFAAPWRRGVASEPGIAEVVWRQPVRLRGVRWSLDVTSALNREI